MGRSFGSDPSPQIAPESRSVGVSGAGLAPTHRIEIDLDDLGVELPTATGSDLWPALQQLRTDTLGAWSLGRWHRPV